MHLNTKITDKFSRYIDTLSKRQQPQSHGNLSRQDLQLIVAAMVG
jgi:hypothetical protein